MTAPCVFISTEAVIQFEHLIFSRCFFFFFPSDQVHFPRRSTDRYSDRVDLDHFPHSLQQSGAHLAVCLAGSSEILARTSDSMGPEHVFGGDGRPSVGSNQQPQRRSGYANMFCMGVFVLKNEFVLKVGLMRAQASKSGLRCYILDAQHWLYS